MSKWEDIRSILIGMVTSKLLDERLPTEVWMRIRVAVSLSKDNLWVLDTPMVQPNDSEFVAEESSGMERSVVYEQEYALYKRLRRAPAFSWGRMVPLNN